MSSLEYNSFLVYFLIAAVQGIILSSLIFFQKPKNTSSTYLGSLIFLFSLSILHGVLEDSIHAFNGKFPIPMNYGMLYGPLAFFHLKSLINPGFRFGRKQLIQFIPSFFFDFLGHLTLFLYASSHMDWAYENIILIRSIALTFGMLTFLHILGYTFLGYRAIRTADFKTNSQLNSIWGWIKIFSTFWMMSLIIITALIPIVYLSIGREDYGYNLFFPMGMVDSLFVYGVGYSYLMKYRSIVQQRFNRASRMKYSNDEIERRKKQIISAFKDDEVFKESSLSVGILSKKLGWSTKDVSWIIGEVFESNFNDWVNQYRIDAFIALSTQPDSSKYSIEGIASAVGFNSKASFYRAFKKATGKTPSEYLSEK